MSAPVTILGGGISGLSAAYYLTKNKVPSITLFEATKRLGGWIKTEQHIKHGFRFETGPRTIRPAGPKGKNTLEMIEDIGLSSSLVPISKNHIAAKNRMIYVNKQLCPLPSNIMSLFKTLPPFSKPLIFSILNDLRIGKSSKHLEDEAMYDFIERRFGTDMAKYLISAMICGICAGDAKQISVKFLMEDLFRNEQKYGGVIKGMLYTMLNNMLNKSQEQVVTANKASSSVLVDRSKTEHWSIYSFAEGLQIFPKTLSDYLEKENVTIKNNSKCTEIKFNSGGVALSVNGNTHETEHLISSVQSYVLAKLVEKQHPQLAEELNAIPYVDVAVVNLQYDGGDLLNPPAFGFLVPPSENLPILGVIYDSCCFDMNGKTVVTVMMGGAFFKEKFGLNPSHKDLYSIATKHVGEILNIKSQPTTGRVNILSNCIPQYVVGHHDRIKRIRKYIEKKQLPLSVCGAAYDGVGVNDVIFSAKQGVQMVKN